MRTSADTPFKTNGMENCPCCKREATLRDKEDGQWFVKCNYCFFGDGWTDYKPALGKTKKEAILIWNKVVAEIKRLGLYGKRTRDIPTIRVTL